METERTGRTRGGQPDSELARRTGRPWRADRPRAVDPARAPPRRPSTCTAWPGSATNWTDLMDELSDVVTGYAVDLPGAGYSPEPPGGDYSIDAHARAVVATDRTRRGQARPPVRQLAGRRGLGAGGRHPARAGPLAHAHLAGPARPAAQVRPGAGGPVHGAPAGRVGGGPAERLCPRSAGSTPRSPCVTPTPAGSTRSGSGRRSRSCAAGTSLPYAARRADQLGAWPRRGVLPARRGEPVAAGGPGRARPR